MSYDDITFERDGDVAWITINREDKGNAFRIQTCREMIDALEIARRDPDCRSVVLTGAGDRFFCLGGDHDGSHNEDDDRFHYDNVFPVVDLYDLIDKMPKPVIAMVNGFAVGGGNVLATVCDLTIAASTAVFRQIGPSMGSFDAGFGTWYLEESVGRKRAKEFWYLNRKYTAEQAFEFGLVNEVVEPERALQGVAGQIFKRRPELERLRKLARIVNRRVLVDRRVRLRHVFEHQVAGTGRKQFDLLVVSELP